MVPNKSCAARDHPISVVIPTMSNPWTLQKVLPKLLAALVRSPEMQHPQSEVVINHGSNQSYASRDTIDRLVRTTQLRKATRNHLVQRQLWHFKRIVHYDGPRADAFAASRFFAAAAARNEIILSIDDDVLPEVLPELLDPLACAVATEPGYSQGYPAGSSPGLHGNQERYCDAKGYENPPNRFKSRADSERYRNRSPPIVLTNFASFSRTLARRFASIYDEWYGDFMIRARGNGEDIVFADAARKLGHVQAHSKLNNGGLLYTLAPSNASYSKQGNHWSVRKVVCCCLASGFRGDLLRRCVFEAYDLCPYGDEKCVSTRPSASLGLPACMCGRFHFGQSQARKRGLWAAACRNDAYVMESWSLSMQDLQPLLEQLARGVPFTYAHFNDGEINSLENTKGKTDRGLQARSPQLSADLRGALEEDSNGLILGVPCKREFPTLHKRAMGVVARNASRTRITAATLLINGNFEQARRLIPQILIARKARVHLVVSAEADINRFANCTGMVPVSVVRVAAIDGYPQSLEAHRDGWKALRGGDVIIVCAGPVGRLLAVEWHRHKPDVTILEMGSFFDPDLTRRSFFDRKGVMKGPRYYSSVQCGERVPAALYQPRARFASCQKKDDVRAVIDEKKIWSQLKWRKKKLHVLREYT